MRHEWEFLVQKKNMLHDITRSSATAEIARDAVLTNRETVIQSHSRSSVVVAIDAAYMTSY